MKHMYFEYDVTLLYHYYYCIFRHACSRWPKAYRKRSATEKTSVRAGHAFLTCRTSRLFVHLSVGRRNSRPLENRRVQAGRHEVAARRGELVRDSLSQIQGEVSSRRVASPQTNPRRTCKRKKREGGRRARANSIFSFLGNRLLVGSDRGQYDGANDPKNVGSLHRSQSSRRHQIARAKRSLRSGKN